MKSIILLYICLLTQVVNATKTIHVFVALCDNTYQGIVKVPEKIGNGQDANNNLYWGCGYGVKTYFKNSSDWKLLKTITNPTSNILERVVFKHKTSDTYLLADAYDGKEIQSCTEDMLKATSGMFDCTVTIDSLTLFFGGLADLVCYTGHNGLMDFSLNMEDYPPLNYEVNNTRDLMILACYSKNYFTPFAEKTGINPLLWSTHLMAPEAYTTKAAIDGWIKGESDQQIRIRAAAAYHLYQKCGEKAALNLLVSGF